MSNQTWIVYKTENADAEDWENRQLLPSGGLTDILEENWDRSGKLPQVGDRTRDHTNLEDSSDGVTHGKNGDWVVTRIQQFSDPDSSDRVVICHCTYQPIAAEWKELKRGASVAEMLKTAVAGK